MPDEGLSQPEWPRAVEIGDASLEIFQPQLEKFEGVTLSGRSALSWTEKDKAPVFGVFWFTTTVAVDRDARLATVESIRVDRVRFPNITKEQEQKLAAILEAEVPKWVMTVSLDAIQANLAVYRAEKRSSEGLRSVPPRMIFANDPAVLLLYAGKPVEQPIPGSSLKRAANTPMFVVLDPATRRWYLSGGTFWYEAPVATGPFTPIASPSPAVQQFFDAHPPPPVKPEGTAAQQASEKEIEEPRSPPRIVVSTDPAELFVFDGPPRYVPVGEDAELLYAENTQRDVLVYVPTSETYVLASGRWFKSKSLSGPWTFVRPDQLPAGFARLPPDSAVGPVRTFVAGTDEAMDAVADSQIPQTTAVKRDQQFQVTYDGEPRFKSIEGTPMAFAVNTPASVIRDAGRYWACDQAVWYVAPSPTGPWVVSDRRPPDIDQVPPSAPVYNTRFVYVYQSTPAGGLRRATRPDTWACTRTSAAWSTAPGSSIRRTSDPRCTTPGRSPMASTSSTTPGSGSVSDSGSGRRSSTRACASARTAVRDGGARRAIDPSLRPTPAAGTAPLRDTARPTRAGDTARLPPDTGLLRVDFRPAAAAPLLRGRREAEAGTTASTPARRTALATPTGRRRSPTGPRPAP